MQFLRLIVLTFLCVCVYTFCVPKYGWITMDEYQSRIMEPDLMKPGMPTPPVYSNKPLNNEKPLPMDEESTKMIRVKIRDNPEECWRLIEEGFLVNFGDGFSSGSGRYFLNSKERVMPRICTVYLPENYVLDETSNPFSNRSL